jgi:hypothetical protein
VETDASTYVCVGVLSQKHEEEDWHPVAFFSKVMAPAECNYAIQDKELLAVVRALKEWRPELTMLTRPFLVITDHEALKYFSTKRQLNIRQAGWAALLAEFELQITYRPGRENVVADALTRRETDIAPQRRTVKERRTQTLLEPELFINLITTSDEVFNDEGKLDSLPQALINAVIVAPLETDDTTLSNAEGEGEALMTALRNENAGHPESLREFWAEVGKEGSPFTTDGRLLLCDGRLVVPEEDTLRLRIVKEIHNTVQTAHPGRNKTIKLAKERFWWPRMDLDIRTYCAACRPCRWSTPAHDKTPGLLTPLEIPHAAGQHWTMDFLSLSAKDKSGHDAVLVVVDRLSKRSHTLPSYATATARDLAMLFYRFLWRIYGTPISVVSDRGPQFVADFWDELCRILRVKIKLSTARHPQSNGQSEIMNQYIVQRLRPFVSFFQDNWSELLPAMDFAQDALPSDTTGLSPFEIEFGRKARMSFDWKEQTTEFTDSKDKLSRQEAQHIADRIHEAWAVARNNMALAQAKQRRASNRKRRVVDFGVGDEVYVLREGWQSQRSSQKLDWVWSGPYKILEQRGESFRLCHGPGFNTPGGYV